MQPKVEMTIEDNIYQSNSAVGNQHESGLLYITEWGVDPNVSLRVVYFSVSLLGDSCPLLVALTSDMWAHCEPLSEGSQ